MAEHGELLELGMDYAQTFWLPVKLPRPLASIRNDP
jgi:hypothetical protein